MNTETVTFFLSDHILSEKVEVGEVKTKLEHFQSVQKKVVFFFSALLICAVVLVIATQFPTYWGRYLVFAAGAATLFTGIGAVFYYLKSTALVEAEDYDPAQMVVMDIHRYAKDFKKYFGDSLEGTKGKPAFTSVDIEMRLEEDMKDILRKWPMPQPIDQRKLDEIPDWELVKRKWYAASAFRDINTIPVLLARAQSSSSNEYSGC